jgi:hypothetical protein
LSGAAREILDRLAAVGATLDRQGDKLVLRAGTLRVPGDLVTSLRRHKSEVLEAVSAEAKERNDFEERAAIIEHDGCVLRAWAEALARLDPDRPRGDVPPRRWRQFVDDAGRFVDRGFAERAATLGWGPSTYLAAMSAGPSTASIGKACAGSLPAGNWWNSPEKLRRSKHHRVRGRSTDADRTSQAVY